MPRGILLASIVAAGIGVHHPEAHAVDVSKETREAAKARVAAALGGSPSDVELSAEPALDVGGCRFLRATHRARPGSHSGQFALLPDDRMVDSFAADGASADAILRACGARAPAEWWAQVVTRFGGVGGVLVDPENSPSAVRKIREAGEAYAPPTLDDARRVITFFVIHYEENQPYKVTAQLADAGGLQVTRTPLEPKAR
jgi:hypothetical protein